MTLIVPNIPWKSKGYNAFLSDKNYVRLTLFTVRGLPVAHAHILFNISAITKLFLINLVRFLEIFLENFLRITIHIKIPTTNTSSRDVSVIFQKYFDVYYSIILIRLKMMV